MRLFSRKLKFILCGLILFLLGYFSLSNTHLSTWHNESLRPVLRQLKSSSHDNKSIDNGNRQQKKQQHGQQVATRALFSAVSSLNNQSASNSSMKHFVAYDNGGFGAVLARVVKCSDDVEVEVTDSQQNADISYYHMALPAKFDESNRSKNHYSMVFTLESEVHSYGGDKWSKADFRMWYNLELSFPGPATYFDVANFLRVLLAPPLIAFEEKPAALAPIVWIVSNCNAHNGRETFMRELMRLVGVDSYGNCMKNKHTHTSEHMKGNVELFAKYKFVIAIENSNCEDYVTEKLVHAVSSGAVPIVAGRDGKPDYLKFMPSNSYINVYDYASVAELADHLKKLTADKSKYEKYIYFRKSHNRTLSDLAAMESAALVVFAKSVFSTAERFLSEIVAKESSEDKLCKIAKYLHSTPEHLVEQQIAAKRRNRPLSKDVCIPEHSLTRHFNIV